MESRPYINTAREANTQLCTCFHIKEETALKNSTAKRKANIHDTVTAFLGNKEINSQDWFETHLLELEAVIAAKLEALIHYKKIPILGKPCYNKNARSDSQLEAEPMNIGKIYGRISNPALKM